MNIIWMIQEDKAAEAYTTIYLTYHRHLKGIDNNLSKE